MRPHLKAVQCRATLDKAGSDATDKSDGRVLLLRMRLQIIQIDAEARITFGVDRDRVLCNKLNVSDSFKVDCCRKNASMLVVCMISTDFGASRCGVGKVLIHEYTPSFALLLY